MGVFRQLGDPLAAAACLCQHHQQAYAEWETVESPLQANVTSHAFNENDTIVQVQITITERCCVVVNAAIMTYEVFLPTDFEIERPFGTIRTSQEDKITSADLTLLHHATWEVLPPGIYTYYLVCRTASPIPINAAWIKAVASDCEG